MAAVASIKKLNYYGGTFREILRKNGYTDKQIKAMRAAEQVLTAPSTLSRKPRGDAIYIIEYEEPDGIDIKNSLDRFAKIGQ